MKRILTQLFFAVAVMVCLSMTAAAQQDGEKKPRPPKEPPPVIVPGDKPRKEKPKEEKPKDDKNKKPEAAVFYFRNK